MLVYHMRSGAKGISSLSVQNASAQASIIWTWQNVCCGGTVAQVMADSRDHLITGLDIGSSSIKVLVAERTVDGRLRHVASSYAESAGVQSGVIVNIGEAARAIEHACYSVEERISQHLPCVCVNIGGPQ